MMHAPPHVESVERLNARSLILAGVAIARLPAVRREDWAQLAADALGGALAPLGVTPVVAIVDTREVKDARDSRDTRDTCDMRNMGPARLVSAGWAGQPDMAAQIPRGFNWLASTVRPAEGVADALLAMLSRAGCSDVRCVAAPISAGGGQRRVVAIALIRSAKSIGGLPAIVGLADMCAVVAEAAAGALGGSEDRPWLTVHEIAVLERLAIGQTVEEIALELHRSPHTIHDHTKSLHRKLGVERRAMLVARAMGVSERRDAPPRLDNVIVERVDRVNAVRGAAAMSLGNRPDAGSVLA